MFVSSALLGMSARGLQPSHGDVVGDLVVVGALVDGDAQLHATIGGGCVVGLNGQLVSLVTLQLECTLCRTCAGRIAAFLV